MDYLSKLPPDLLATEITHLKFSDVESFCKLDNKINDFCMSPKYRNHWRSIIENAFSQLAYYETVLIAINEKLGYVYTKYNYLVYTGFVKILPLNVQANIYKRQGDQKSYNRVFNEAKEKFKKEIQKYRVDFVQFDLDVYLDATLEEYRKIFGGLEFYEDIETSVKNYIYEYDGLGTTKWESVEKIIDGMEPPKL